MPTIDVNWAAVLVATVAYFVIGALWYSMLFGKQWMAAARITDEHVADGSNPLIYLLQALLAFMLMTSLAYFISNVFETDSIMNGIHIALMLWLVVLFTMAKDYIWSPHQGWLLGSINFGYPLVGLVVGALIITPWQ